ncbi:MAG: single-stranded-DNA-specific exonuclease RecJ [Clostridiales bacterium]|nr:single-stranded-DNA-specific exonuclease RecJ [Clostridiales bacterium]
MLSQYNIHQGSTVIVFDTETTGLSPQTAKVIQFSGIRYLFDGNLQAEETGRINTYINPEEPISREITRITGITDKTVVHAPPMRDVFPSIHAFMASADAWVGHNISFDIRMLEAEAGRLGAAISRRTVIDTMGLSRKNLRLPDNKLATVYHALFPEKTKQFHNSMEDVCATAEIFFWFLSREIPQAFMQPASPLPAGLPRQTPVKKWVIHAKRGIDIHAISNAFNIHPAIARAITNRGVTDIAAYLGGGAFYSPVYMKDMTKGVSIIKDAIQRKEKIRVIGDYDIDGVNATYILQCGIARCGGDVSVAIPDRITDGYGVNQRLIQQALDDGVQTVITCDNGISALDAIGQAKSLGMRVVVTDHHAVPYREDNNMRVYLQNPADAVIDPHQQDDHYPFKELCGAAVAWKFVQMIYKMNHVPVQEADVFLENAAIATVGDVVDLQDENRTIVKRGLAMLPHTKNPGLQALIAACGLSGNAIKSYHIGFILGPCINASGRLDTALKAYKLLCCKGRVEADALAEELVALNQERRAMTDAGVEEAVKISEAMPDRVLVIFMPGCHESIAGIIAGKVRERFHKPVFVLTRGEGRVKGSGRSIEAYSMFEEMNKIADVFLGFGGHPMAAGLSLEEGRVDEFRERINACCTLTDDDMVEKICIDDTVPVEYTSDYMMAQVEMMQPFGKANPKPVFADRSVPVRKISIIGKTKDTAKIIFRKSSGFEIEGLLFHRADELMGVLEKKFGQEAAGDALEGRENPISLSFTYDMSVNEFRGERKMQVILKEFC